MCYFLLIKIKSQHSDRAILEEIGERLKRERLNQNRSQVWLAEEAGVARKTITNLEAGEGCSMATLLSVLRALGRLENLDAFLPDPGISPLQLVELKGKQRQRASRSRKPGGENKVAEEEGWSWGKGE